MASLQESLEGGFSLYREKGKGEKEKEKGKREKGKGKIGCRD